MTHYRYCSQSQFLKCQRSLLFCFMYRNSSNNIQRISELSVENPCLDSTVVNHSRSFWRGRARAKHDGFPESCTQPTGNSSTANRQYWWKAHTEKVCLLGVTSHKTPYKLPRTQIGEPQTHEKNWVPYIRFTHPTRNIYWIQWYDGGSPAPTFGGPCNS